VSEPGAVGTAPKHNPTSGPVATTTPRGLPARRDPGPLPVLTPLWIDP